LNEARSCIEIEAEEGIGDQEGTHKKSKLS